MQLTRLRSPGFQKATPMLPRPSINFGEYNKVSNYSGEAFKISLEKSDLLMTPLAAAIEKHGQDTKTGLMAIADALSRKINP